MDTLTTLENSLVYLVVLAGGYALKRFRVLKKEDAGFLSALIMNVTLPAAVLKGAANASFNSSFVIIFLSAMLLNVLLLSAGFFFSKGRPGPERGLMILNVNTFNNGNFAIPFLSALVSSDAFAAMGMYDGGSALFTFGPNIALAQKAMEQGGKKVTLGDIFRKLFTTPSIWAYILMVVFSIVHWQPPALVMDVISMSGSANAFLAMLCVGILFEVQLPKSGYGLILTTLVTRYVICGLFAAGLWFFLPAPPETVRTLVVMTMAPVASCATMITIEAGCDGTMAAVINSISIVVSIIIMVLLLLLLPMPVRG